jgi:transcriptional regulator with XRE-family HTH domain
MTEQEGRQTGQVWALIQGWMDAMHYPPSQRKLAERLDVSPSTITDWKYRVSFPKADVIEALAAELGMRYERVLDAFLADHGYLLERPTKGGAQEVRKHG